MWAAEAQNMVQRAQTRQPAGARAVAGEDKMVAILLSFWAPPPCLVPQDK